MIRTLPLNYILLIGSNTNQRRELCNTLDTAVQQIAYLSPFLSPVVEHRSVRLRILFHYRAPTSRIAMISSSNGAEGLITRESCRRPRPPAQSPGRTRVKAKPRALAPVHIFRVVVGVASERRPAIYLSGAHSRKGNDIS